MVHQVVVQQRVVVVRLYADGSRHGLGDVVAVEAVGHEQQGGADALAAAVQDVGNGFVQSFGTGGVGNGLEGVFDKFFHDGENVEGVRQGKGRKKSRRL